MGPILYMKLFNFKRFQETKIVFQEGINLLIGDNESGKSSILTAIDLVIRGSRSKVENMGLDSLFNKQVIENFLAGKRRVEDLPTMKVELYLSDQDNHLLNGENNTDDKECDGLYISCEPMDEYSADIKQVLSEGSIFPFEFYEIKFMTFRDQPYNGYKKYLKHLLIDNSLVSNEYAIREYVRSIYDSHVNEQERSKHNNEYRKSKEKFKNDVLKGLNNRIKDYSFVLRMNSKSSLDSDLTIAENGINIEHRGKGRQCFVKTDFSLKKSDKSSKLDVILLEEPENHLSHLNMKKLVEKIASSYEKQIFVATHNDLISTRLDLRRSILLNSSSNKPAYLNDLSKETANFFIKAPNNNILEFVLSKKVILVEGDAEYMLMDKFFREETKTFPEKKGIHIISVGGTSFKRYLELARLLDIKTAVIRDNDGDYKNNCEKRYGDYISETIQVFSETNNKISTFEIAIYNTSQAVCDSLFAKARRTLSVQDYMIKNKADAAFALLDDETSSLVTPVYIKRAIQWITEE